MSTSRFLSSLFFRFSKWELVVDKDSPLSGGILVGAPHTSNWDFLILLALAGQTGMDARWLGKKSLFDGPLGPIVRALGGIPVNRDSAQGLVEGMAQEFKSNPKMVLAITPKGTRGIREYWKSGFYRIAKTANVPMMLAYVDSATKTTGVGPSIFATDNVSADMDKIRDFYKDKIGFRPEFTCVPRLRIEDEAPGQNS